MSTPRASFIHPQALWDLTRLAEGTSEARVVIAQLRAQGSALSSPVQGRSLGLLMKAVPPALGPLSEVDGGPSRGREGTGHSEWSRCCEHGLAPPYLFILMGNSDRESQGMQSPIFFFL